LAIDDAARIATGSSYSGVSHPEKTSELLVSRAEVYSGEFPSAYWGEWALSSAGACLIFRIWLCS